VSSTTDEQTESGAARYARFSRTRGIFVFPVLVYLTLVLLGVTNSNIGISSLRENPDGPLGAQIGTSQGIRSDEWGTESPIWLGAMANSDGADLAPLSVSNGFFAQLPDGPVSAIVFFDGTVVSSATWMPDAMLFAAKWWLPTLLLFIGLPVLFRQITGSLRWGYLAAILIAFAPASMWWSGRPVNTMGFVAAGCALAIYGTGRLAERRWLRATAAFLVGGILLARTPTYYQPLAIVVGVPIVVATAAFILWSPHPWRARLTSLAAICASGATWTALLFWENLDTVLAGLETAYPGERASTGGAMSFGMLFGGTNLTWLESIATGSGINQSEISSAFTVLLPVVAILFAAGRWRGSRPHAAVTATITGFAVFWLSWATVSWGSFGALIPLVNRVPNTRAMLGVGFLAILAFCLLMAQWRPAPRLAVPFVAAGSAALISAYAGSSLQTAELPALTTWMIWVSALVVGAVIFVLVRFPQRWWALVIAGSAVVGSTATATPILFGLGDLRASETAQEFLAWGEDSRADRTIWASSSQDVDSLMMATAVPSLSGRQQIGPDVIEWEKLDPDGAYEQMWNRGGLHVMFEWADEPGITFSLPVADTVVIKASPCTIADRIPEFRYAVSADHLDEACLTEIDQFTWSGVDYRVYEVGR
jgi:hypothetical protein